tara:strand:- start:1047 stop:1835 length:789 start_codon:yes stop_codon:yes gene_type:complete
MLLILLRFFRTGIIIQSDLKMRINKYLSLCGLGSRRKVEEFIKEGRISFRRNPDGLNPIDSFSFAVKDHDEIFFDGEKVKPKVYKYILLNKPRGYITTKDDPMKRKSIMDLIPKSMHHLSPVGRLDKDTSGLIILTNDGNLYQKISHPRYKFIKHYLVEAKGKVSSQKIALFSRGLTYGKEKLKAHSAAVVASHQGRTVVSIKLTEGKNREIRKMFSFIKKPIISLERIAIGPISDKKLQKGKWRSLKPLEISRLKKELGIL